MTTLGWCLAAAILGLLLLAGGYVLTLLHIAERQIGVPRHGCHVNLAPDESEETKKSD